MEQHHTFYSWSAEDVMWLLIINNNTCVRGKKLHLSKTLTLMCTPGAFRITFAMLLHYVQWIYSVNCCQTALTCHLFCFVCHYWTELQNYSVYRTSCSFAEHFFLHCYCFYSAFHGFAPTSQVWNTPYNRCLDTDVQYNVASLSAAVQLLLHNWMKWKV